MIGALKAHITVFGLEGFRRLPQIVSFVSRYACGVHRTARAAMAPYSVCEPRRIQPGPGGRRFRRRLAKLAPKREAVASGEATLATDAMVGMSVEHLTSPGLPSERWPTCRPSRCVARN